MPDKSGGKYDSKTIVHISDFHAGSQYFVANLLTRTIDELNALGPEIVVVSGDLTDMGFRQEYKTAKAFLDRLECPNLIVVPGNHDSRNVGYVHFEEIFGARRSILRIKGATIIGIDSSEPDLESGRVGREHYPWIRESFNNSDDFKILALHHHLLPVPGTGRERNIVYDAGDILEVLIDCNVDLVLCGHKHVPYAWRLENLVVINAGTVSTLRLRGHTKPCYNVIKASKERMRVYRKYPFGGQELVVDFEVSKSQDKYLKWKKII